MIQVSAVAHMGDRGQEFQVVLYGEAGTLEVDFNFRDGYVIRGARSHEGQIKALTIPADILNGVDPASFEQFVRAFTTQSVGTRLFIDAIVNDWALSPSFHDRLKAQTVIEAAMEVNKRECSVTLG